MPVKCSEYFIKCNCDVTIVPELLTFFKFFKTRNSTCNASISDCDF